MDWKMVKEILPPKNSGENKNLVKTDVQYIDLACCGVYLVKLLVNWKVLCKNNISTHCHITYVEQMDMHVSVDMHTKPAFRI